MMEVVRLPKTNPFRGRHLRVLYPYPPIVVNSTDVKLKALAEKRKAREAEQNRKDQAASRQRKRDAKAEAKEHNRKHKHRHKKPDQARAVTVWLKESEIVEALSDPKFEMTPLGRPLTRKEQRDVIERVFTARVRSTLKK